MVRRNRKVPSSSSRSNKEQTTLQVAESSDSDSDTSLATSNKRKSGSFKRSTSSKKKTTPKVTSTTPSNHVEFCTNNVRIKFPFVPYKSQQDMMSKIVEALQKQENALLESPTGSGKSLAILCGALAWLEAEKVNRNIYRENIRNNQSVESPYFSNPTNENTDTTSTSISSCSTGFGSSCAVKKEEVEPLKPGALSTSIPTPTSCQQQTDGKVQDPVQNFNINNIPKPRKAIEIKYEDDQPAHDNDTSSSSSSSKPGRRALAVGEIYQPLPKIYVGSRTHKQITQLVKELKSNTVYRPRMAVLGSRKHYCINESIREDEDKNDACRDLLENGPGCVYRKDRKDAEKLEDKMAIKSDGKPRIWDMEDLIRKGRSMTACPYYAARSLAERSELIFCPYNYLISPSIRKAMDINLEKSIVILDEAHNIESAARDA
ncbi:Fanconi anemia group J protein, partial [Podila epigama]